MRKLLNDNDLVLMEASIVECLRRSGNIDLHPQLIHAPLIYDVSGRQALAGLYQSYIDIAIDAERPFLMFTPTWRANHERVTGAGASITINIDAAHFLRELQQGQGAWKGMIRIGGMIGCRNDCYQPQEGLSASEAEKFHGWQLGQLQQGGVDFLIAQTLPNVIEAIGIARAMEKTGLEYIISFVISRDGRVLDGTDLETAIGIIDAETRQPPLGYMVNCAYPSFLCAEHQSPGVFERLVGYQANASSLDHCELDGAEDLHREDIGNWGELMLELNREYGVKILGGCCGTDTEHLRYISREG
ncbi:MAG: homocysteine S-methyltransferase family protein [Xanthomonadales bacterium]|nr:homocysteine S-methyltransferase family protein [Xanthomonadales bacterium]